MVLSDTGGGHKASAKAIQAALDELYPGKFFCEITDIWTDYGNWPFNTLVPAYQWAAKHQWPWRCLYYYGEIPAVQWMTQRVANFRCYHNWRAYIQSFSPDIVVSVSRPSICSALLCSSSSPCRPVSLSPPCLSCFTVPHHHPPPPPMSLPSPPSSRPLPPPPLTPLLPQVHPLCQTLPLKILEDMGGGKRKVPFVTVVTDLGSASSTWFHRGVDRCCVPGDAVEKLAYKNGLKPGQVSSSPERTPDGIGFAVPPARDPNSCQCGALRRVLGLTYDPAGEKARASREAGLLEGRCPTVRVEEG